MTFLSRRGFLQAAVATSAGAALATPSMPVGTRGIRAACRHSLGGNLALITGGGGNVVAMGSPEGALLVDGGSKAKAAAVLKLALKTVNAKQAAHAVQHALASRPDRRQRAGRQAGRAHHRAGKHEAVADAQDHHRLAATGLRSAARRPRCPTRASTPPTPRVRRRHAEVRPPGPGAHRWRSLRVLHQGQRAGSRWRGLQRGLAAARLADRRLDRRTGRRL